MNPQTVVKEQYEVDRLTFSNDLLERNVEFEIYGQTVDRSYEDRDVYFSMKTDRRRYTQGVVAENLKAEDAITLGMKLIEHGRRAMLANMYNHQHIHKWSVLTSFVKEGRVKEIKFIPLDHNPPNYGSGYVLYKLVAVFHKGKRPKYYNGFNFETVIYWSPLDDEFEEQLKRYGGGVPVNIVGYDREAEVAKFKAWCNVIEKEQEEVAELWSDRSYTIGVDWSNGEDLTAICVSKIGEPAGVIERCEVLTKEQEEELKMFMSSINASCSVPFSAPACLIEKLFATTEQTENKEVTK